MRPERTEHTKLNKRVNAVEKLPAASQFTVFAMRVWSSAMRQKIPLDHALGRLFTDFSCQPALTLFDECMVIAALSAPKPMTLGCCPSNPNVVADEVIVLSCLRAIENKSTAKAETIIAQVVMQPMDRTFCRPAAEFVQHLNTSGLSFVKSPRLSLVEL